MIESGIYVGSLRHRRFKPVLHQFTYPLFMVFLDVDRIPELMRLSRLVSYNKPNIVSYQERDHFGDLKKSLRERIEGDAEETGLNLTHGKIFLLTHLRYFGYNFNPVSFFYCYDSTGSLHAVAAEVNNTFGETHNYWLLAKSAASKHLRCRFQKRFHVSPFMGSNQQYDWTLTAPSDRLIAECVTYENDQAVFDSTLLMNRREWSPRELHRALAQFPAMTLKVIMAIHWQAVRLLCKKVAVVSHPGRGKFDRANVQHWGASWRVE
jgi:uncharacterized protein